MIKSIGIRIRHLIESFVSAFLLLLQHIPHVGPWYGFMLVPLGTYIVGILLGQSLEYVKDEFEVLFLSPRLLFARLIALAGFVVFLIALVQFLMRRGGLTTNGLYSVVRHPQYFGLIIMTYGITLMCFQYTRSIASNVLWLWLLEASGYMLLAGYEEHHLSSEYGESHRQYKAKTAFIFPAPRIGKMPELISSFMIVFVIGFLLVLPRY